MPHIFISYAKRDTRLLAEKLFKALNEVPGLTAWMDMSLEADSSWAQQIAREIDRCDYMVVLLSPDLNRPETETQARSFVMNEIDYAQQDRKLILPVMVIKTKQPVQIAGIQFVDLTQAPTNPAPIVERVCKRFNLETPGQKREREVREHDAQLVTEWEAELRSERESQLATDLEVEEPRQQMMPQSASQPMLMRPVVRLRPQEATTFDYVRDAAPTSQSPLQPVPVRSALQPRSQEDRYLDTQLIEMHPASRQPVNKNRLFIQAGALLLSIAFTIGVLFWNTGAQSGSVAIDRTPTIHSEIQSSGWIPVSQDFDGITMMKVPLGCFDMGSNDGGEDERPVNQQCFKQFFWIDRTEVTQADFERLGGRKANPNAFDGDQRPVEQISWFEARDFCVLRGMSLPTEREWEYAARGPDNWVYPWGNQWNVDNVVWNGNSNNLTANVGSRPAGASWVGALDMSGNVWEWVSSLYEGYPYLVDDGRETDTSDGINARYVARGGAWSSYYTVSLRAAVRFRNYPDARNDYLGFRCARSA